jgi:hypothetical protein
MLHREHVCIKVRNCRALRVLASVARVFISSPPAPKALAHGPWQSLPPAGVAKRPQLFQFPFVDSAHQH